ncbi:MAG: hypothetical protein ABSB32_18075 [Thermodesulfobacteriota bacterium]
MKTCAQAHSEISFREGRCPMCQVVTENQKMKKLIQELEINFMIRDSFNHDLDSGEGDLMMWMTPITGEA